MKLIERPYQVVFFTNFSADALKFEKCRKRTEKEEIVVTMAKQILKMATNKRAADATSFCDLRRSKHMAPRQRIAETREKSRWEKMMRLLLLATIISSCRTAAWIHAFPLSSANNQRSVLPGPPITVPWSKISSTSSDVAGESSASEKHWQITNSNQNVEKNCDNVLLLNQLMDDWKALTELRPPLPSADPSITAAIVSAGSSYTRIWTHHTWNVHSDPPHWRYFRHVRKWRKSTTARKILPTVALATGWSIAVSLLAKYWQLRSFQIALTNAGSASIVSLLSAPLALLLTLRANASMARLLEARQAWGRLVLQARGLSSILGTYVYPLSPPAAILAVRHLSILGWLLKALVRGEDEDSQQQVLLQMLANKNRTCEKTRTEDDSEYQWLLQQPKRCVAIPSRIRQICAMAMASTTTSSSIQQQQLQQQQLLIVEERIRELEAVVGICERLFGSPIPPTYTRHLSRVMSLWLLLLPVSLIAAAQLRTLGVAFVTSIAAYVFIGLDEVGMEIENVFRLLPLQQLAAAAQKDVQDQFMMIQCPPPDFS